MSVHLTPSVEALSQEQLVTMLSNILHLVDNNARRQTEADVVRALVQPANLIHMVNILCHTDPTNPNTAPLVSAGVRQLAAVLLRKKIFSLWHALPSSAQLELRALLLRQLGHETVRPVRLALAHIVVRLAKMESSGLLAEQENNTSNNNNEGGWPELYEATYAAVHDERAEMRELAMVLLYSVAEVFADDAIDQSVRIARATEAVLRGIVDADASVQTAALKAAAALLPPLMYSAKQSAAMVRQTRGMRQGSAFDGRGKGKKRSQTASSVASSSTSDVLAQFVQQLVTLCVHVLSVGGAARESEQSKLGIAAVEVLRELLLELPQRRYEHVMSHVLEQLVGCAGEASTSALVRQSCASALGDLAEARTRFLTKSNTNNTNSGNSSSRLTMVVRLCLSLMAMDDTIFMPDGEDAQESPACADHHDSDDANNMAHDDGDSDTDDAEAQSPCMIGGFLLSTLATALPSRLFTHTVMPILAQASEAPAEPPHPRTKKAVMIALACLAEGNPSYLRRRLRTTLQLTERYLSDADSAVTREAAAFALAFFCDHLQPEVLMYHERLLPLLVARLQDGSESVRLRAAAALETVCEGASPAVVERYVESLLLPGVLHALGSSARRTQRRLCAVLASMAGTGCASMRARGPEVLALLRQPFEMPWDECAEEYNDNNSASASSSSASLLLQRCPNPSQTHGNTAHMSARERQDIMALRAQATETVGVVARAVGAEVFAPHVDYFMTHVAQHLRTRHALLREQSFGFLSCLCEVLGAAFMPYLDDCLGCALRSVTEDRAVYANRHPLADAAGAVVPAAAHALLDDMDPVRKPSHTSAAAHGSLFSESLHHQGNDSSEEPESNDDEDSEGAEEEIHMRVRTADVEEKSAAVHCVGVCAQVLRGPAGMGMARVERCWQAISALEGHFCAQVRANALLASAKLMQAAYGAGMNTSSSAGTATATTVTTQLTASYVNSANSTESNNNCMNSTSTAEQAEYAPSEEVRALVDELVHLTLLRVMREETDKDVVCAALEAMTLLITFFGPHLFPHGPHALVQELIQLLRHRRPCQRAEHARDRARVDDTPHTHGSTRDEARHDDDDDDDDDDADEFMTEDSSEDELASDASEEEEDERLFGESDWTTTLTPDALIAELTLPDEHDEVLDGAVDLVEAVATVYGEEFGVRFYPFLFPLLVRHAAPVAEAAAADTTRGMRLSTKRSVRASASAERPAEDVVMALGAMASVQSRVGPSVNARYFDEALRVCERTVQQCEDAAGRANAAYLMRVLIENTPQRFGEPAMVHRVLRSLGALVGSAQDNSNTPNKRVKNRNHARSMQETHSNNHIDACTSSLTLPDTVPHNQHHHHHNNSTAAAAEEEEEEEIPEATDNAMSATCSLLRCAPPEMVPWAAVVPVVLAYLPMRVDHAENGNAVHTLVYLFQSRVDVLSTGPPAWLPALTQCVARVLAGASVKDEEKQLLVGAVGAAVGTAESSLSWLWQQTLSALRAEELAVLTAVGLGRA